jgi:hypothetical protein
LLASLQTPQVYSHMGIMVDDFKTIRHSTAASDRMQAYPAGNVLGLDLPMNGFEPDKVKYGWPGTLTQSVDEALAATKPELYPPLPNDQTPTYLYCDRDNGTTRFADPDADNFCFKISELSFSPVSGLGIDSRDAVVVMPCNSSEMQHPELRDILHAIADEMKGIAGHYRFFAYTRAAIAEDPAFRGDGPMPVFRWDSGEKKWVPIETTLFDPGNPCAPPSKAAPVTSTVPVVCSSAIWLAVQRFNARSSRFHVVLDSDDPRGGEPSPPAGCARLVAPEPSGDVRDPAGETPDGLYFFTEADRAAVAASFHEGLQQEVRDELAAKWTSIASAIEKAEGKAIPAIFSLSLVNAAAAEAGFAVDALKAILGISADSAAAILGILTSMPEHIANQLANSFTFDNAGSADETSDAWKDPGIGRAVGPADIAWFWDGTLSMEQVSGKTVVRGIYGQNQKLALQQPGFGTVPNCQWTLSPGPGILGGMVRLRGAPLFGPGVPGAKLTIACVQGMTNSNGFYSLNLPAGTYWATATWQDPKTQNLWKINETVTVPFDDTGTHDFILNPPPILFREVTVAVSGDAVDTGFLAKGATPIWGCDSILLGPRGNPADPMDTNGLTGTKPINLLPPYSDNNAVRVTVNANLLAGGYVDGTVTADMLEDGDVEHSETVNFGPIAPGASAAIPTFSMSTGGLFPDKATVNVTINNEQSYGPPQ